MIATIRPNSPRMANTPRQPSRSPITPANEAPTRLPVRPTASSRRDRHLALMDRHRSPINAIAIGNTPPATSPAATRIATSSEKLVATAQTSAASATTSRQTFISRVLPKKSPTVPSAGCTSA